MLITTAGSGHNRSGGVLPDVITINNQFYDTLYRKVWNACLPQNALHGKRRQAQPVSGMIILIRMAASGHMICEQESE